MRVPATQMPWSSELNLTNPDQQQISDQALSKPSSNFNPPVSDIQRETVSTIYV